MGWKFNVGCGRDVRPGYINVDKYPVHGVSFYDLEGTDPLCVMGLADEIVCRDVLEHVKDLSKVMTSLALALRHEGRLVVRVPHFTSRNNATDPTHRRQFSSRTFACFTVDGRGREHYLSPIFSRQVLVHITFARWNPINRLVEWAVNLHPRMQDLYEETFLRALFPAENLVVELEK